MKRLDLNIESSNETSARRHFTLAEANRALVLVKRIVSDVVNYYGQLVDLQETIDAAQGNGAYDRCEATQRQLVDVAHKLQAYAEELDDVGVELKDWSVGVVDFPCMIDGREAYLCWRHGEDQVEYWHELDEGSSGRQPIADMIIENVTL